MWWKKIFRNIEEYISEYNDVATIKNSSAHINEWNKKHQALVVPDLGSDISIILNKLRNAIKAKIIGKTTLWVVILKEEFEQEFNIFKIDIGNKKVKFFWVEQSS